MRDRSFTMLAPLRDSQNSELSAEKWYGYQVEYEELELRWRYPPILRLEQLLHAGDGGCRRPESML